MAAQPVTLRGHMHKRTLQRRMLPTIGQRYRQNARVRKWSFTRRPPPPTQKSLRALHLRQTRFFGGLAFVPIRFSLWFAAHAYPTCLRPGNGRASSGGCRCIPPDRPPCCGILSPSQPPCTSRYAPEPAFLILQFTGSEFAHLVYTLLPDSPTSIIGTPATLPGGKPYPKTNIHNGC